MLAIRKNFLMFLGNAELCTAVVCLLVACEESSDAQTLNRYSVCRQKGADCLAKGLDLTKCPFVPSHGFLAELNFVAAATHHRYSTAATGTTCLMGIQYKKKNQNMVQF